MKAYLFCLVLVLVITSCGPAKTDIDQLEDKTTSLALSPTVPSATSTPMVGDASTVCLSPLEDFAFPIGDTEITPLNENPQIPPYEWKQISRVPGSYENGASQSIEILAVRSWNTKTEIWARGNIGELLHYDVQNDQWQTVDSISPGSIRLFLDNSNELWAARVVWNDAKVKLPLLMRYDDRQRRFVEVLGAFSDTDNLRFSILEPDSKGVVWAILEDKSLPDGQMFGLYSLNLATLELKYYSLGDEGILPSMAILPDDEVAILDGRSEEYRDRSTLLIYDPQTTQTQHLLIPSFIYNNRDSTYQYGPDLFLDTANRVWLGDLAWIDLSEWAKGRFQWFQVVRSPVFIGMFTGNPSWSWAGPHFTTETPDGRLWYDSPRGAGWLDPNGGRWCVFTSYSSRVLTDNEQNLWIISDGWLYRNEAYHLKMR